MIKSNLLIIILIAILISYSCSSGNFKKHHQNKLSDNQYRKYSVVSKCKCPIYLENSIILESGIRFDQFMLLDSMKLYYDGLSVLKYNYSIHTIDKNIYGSVQGSGLKELKSLVKTQNWSSILLIKIYKIKFVNKSSRIISNNCNIKIYPM